MEKLKDFLKQLNFANIKAFVLKYKVQSIIGLAVLLLALAGGMYALLNRKTDLVSQVNVTFKGYNGAGTLKYNSEEIEKSAQKAVLLDAGISKSDADKIVADSSYASDLASASSETAEKLVRAENALDSVSYDFDKTDSLSNGDKVTFTVKVASDNSPIKEGSKTFTVEGLKKSKSTTLKAILKDNPLTYSGYNGYGSVSEKALKKYDITSSENDNLSNGDTVTVKLDTTYVGKLESSGIIVKNAEASQKVTVSGLKELSDISNIPDAYSKLDDYVKSENKNTSDEYSTETYTIEAQTDYIGYRSASEAFYASDAKEGLNIRRIYKITKTTVNSDKAVLNKGETKTETGYYIYGYDNLEIYENKLILSDIKSKSDNSYSKYEDLDSAVSELKSSDFSEYKAK
ncbi:hypothetical protein [Streptococcus ferus]|uniref:hypothetical protein n=1 Tax=Streptococcus ferus TaxID=1345 RepID=UPI00359FC41C